jgi:hypothetical protein
MMPPDPSLRNVPCDPNPPPLPLSGVAAKLEPLDDPTERVALPNPRVTVESTNLMGAQPTDPPWARIVFLLFQGREVHWGRVILMVAWLCLLLSITLGGFLVMIAVLPHVGWVYGLVGVGSVTAGTLTVRRYRQTPCRGGLTANPANVIIVSEPSGEAARRARTG